MLPSCLEVYTQFEISSCYIQGIFFSGAYVSVHLLFFFIYYRCEVSPFHFGYCNENNEREEGERKYVDLVLMSLDNMVLND